MQRSMLQRMSNHRFRHTEKSILDAVLSSRKILSVRAIIKRAHISRTTFYRHHRSAQAIVPDFEAYVLQKYHRLMRGLLRRPKISIRTLYLQLLVFIAQNQEAFTLIVSRAGDHIIEQMIHSLTPRLSEHYHFPLNSSSLVVVYVKEVAGVIELWIRDDCKAPDTEVLADIMYLTKFVRQHLSGLIR